ncbi:MAG: outer membrane beta-barrel protein [Cyclobacteriaceae bacterium]|nr:outer membrane beta-barrel protein [Cyclobacteriaceae bacterium]
MKNLNFLTAILVLSFLCQTMNLIAQKSHHYKEGYILTLEGDTLYGFVQYLDWAVNPEVIAFKEGLNDEARFISVQDVAGFFVADELYLSYLVEYDSSSVQESRMSRNSGFELKKEKVFLYVLAQTENLSLLSYKDARLREHFFILPEDGQIQWLKHKKYKKTEGGVEMITEIRAFQGQLSYYMSACPALNTKISKAAYHRRSLLPLFNEYSKCMGESLTAFSNKESFTIHAGLTGGFNLTKAQFRDQTTNNEFYHLSGPNFRASTSASVGAFIEFSVPRTLGKWSLYNDIMLNSYAGKGSSEWRGASSGHYMTSDVDFSFSYIALSNLARYHIPMGNSDFRFFMNVGINNGLMISHTNELQETEYLFSATPVTRNEPAIGDLKKHEMSWIAGAGACYKRLQCEMRYQRGNGASGYMIMNSVTQRTYVLLAYRIL